MNKKATVDLIKKIAQDLDFFPGTSPTTQARPSRGRPVGDAGGELRDFDAPATHPTGGSGNVGGGVPQIKKMQQSLIDLAQAVTSQVNVQGMGSDNVQEAGEASQRDSFNNFLTKHFMRGADVQGQEFDPNSAAKNPSQANRMTTIMDTMSRIGDSKTRSMTADGRWGPLTNNALRNAYAFAFAMLQLAHNFQTPPQAYNQADLAKFKELIPPDEEVTPVIRLTAEAIQNAGLLTQHLNAMQRMYGEIKSDILQNPGYQTYIEGDTPFATYKQSGTGFNQQEKQMYDQLASGDAKYNKTFSFFLPRTGGPPGSGVTPSISITDLMSGDAFSKWYYAQKDPAVRETTLPALFGAIRKALQGSSQVGY